MKFETHSKIFLICILSIIIIFSMTFLLNLTHATQEKSSIVAIALLMISVLNLMVMGKKIGDK